MPWRPRKTATGAATTNGNGIDTTVSVAGTAQIVDISAVSRPLALDIKSLGNMLQVSTTTVVAALTDAAHTSWTELRSNGLSTIEIDLAARFRGLKFTRISGTATSTVRVYSLYRGPEYNPVYDQFYDVSSAGTQDALRLFDQATFGQIYGQAQAFTGTFGGWIDAQIALTPAPLTLEPVIVDAFSGAYYPITAGHELWRKFSDAEDQLRWRMTFAVGQLVVASSVPGGAGGGLATKEWWNRIYALSLNGNYRGIIEAAIKHRLMGDFLNNNSNNAKDGVIPSVNFSRELLQLFTMGIHELNKDGSPVLLANGANSLAYRQSDVASLGRILCGYGMSVFIPVNDRPVNGDMINFALIYNQHWYNGPAVTFLGTSFAQVNSAPSDALLESRTQTCIDLIFNTPTTAVYVCQRLISKLVTDNPSPRYIRRVVAAFENNGSGVRGDMRAIARAILLDPDARGNTKAVTAGRAQEPVLNNCRLKRYAQAIPLRFWGVDGSVDERDYLHEQQGSSLDIFHQMSQRLGQPSTVFNDYNFDYKIEEGYFGGAAQLWKSGPLICEAGRLMSNAGTRFVTTNSFDLGLWDMTGIVADFTNNTALVDRLLYDLWQGRTPEATARSEMIAAANYLDVQAGMDTRKKAIWLVNTIRLLPETHEVV